MQHVDDLNRRIDKGVGSGSAGSVVASRLSEDPNHSVLLLEAGIEPNKLSYIPLMPLIQNADLINPPNWGYRVHPQKRSFFGFHHNSPPWLAGRVLGGTSNLNFNLYVRGQRKDYDLWAQQGATGWSWKDIFGYFIRAENNINYHNEFHGVGGPLTVSHSPYYSPLLKNFLGAIREMGLPIRDFNTDRHDSFYISQGTIENGKRKNSYTAYIKPNLHRSNLRVVTSALVTKVVSYKRLTQF
ncbi:uncharacterized protein LOC111641413 [Centruroides sculpturatus]|uniref:uncharacterized protein LOC111641413 n=1 Tax=Centruroides sculpturatus TaxID=218467 RepID=UPI000C6D90D8|nr:uncharacterized protein LOC111641413 [Centruroides sculpturatus]